jgi:hypothetical protein
MPIPMKSSGIPSCLLSRLISFMAICISTAVNTAFVRCGGMGRTLQSGKNQPVAQRAGKLQHDEGDAMGSRVLVVVPEAPVAAASTAVAERPLKTDGLRLGILDNSKGNADHLLRFIAQGIQAVLAVSSVISLRKNSVSLPAPVDILDKLAAEADFVVSAMAD